MPPSTALCCFTPKLNRFCLWLFVNIISPWNRFSFSSFLTALPDMSISINLDNKDIHIYIYHHLNWNFTFVGTFLEMIISFQYVWGRHFDSWQFSDSLYCCLFYVCFILEFFAFKRVLKLSVYDVLVTFYFDVYWFSCDNHVFIKNQLFWIIQDAKVSH